MIAAAGAVHADVVGCAFEFARRAETGPACGYHWGAFEAVVRRANAQYPLGDGVVVPRRRTREPGILGLAVRGRVATRDHLRIKHKVRSDALR